MRTPTLLAPPGASEHCGRVCPGDGRARRGREGGDERRIEAGDLPAFREAARDIETDLSAVGPERQARALVERLALLAAAAALRECAPPMIGDIFARTRLAERHSGLFGTSAIESGDADIILRRTLPV